MGEVSLLIARPGLYHRLTGDGFDPFSIALPGLHEHYLHPINDK